MSEPTSQPDGQTETLPHQLVDSPRSWPEDYSHENGNYINACIHCDLLFMGHKRRVCCKVCSTKPDGQTDLDATPRVNAAIAFDKEDLGVSYFQGAHLEMEAYGLERELNRANAEVARLKGERDEWKPIETAPRDGTWVMGTTELGVVMKVHFCPVEKQWGDDEGSFRGPTKWKPCAAERDTLTAPLAKKDAELRKISGESYQHAEAEAHAHDEAMKRETALIQEVARLKREVDQAEAMIVQSQLDLLKRDEDKRTLTATLAQTTKERDEAREIIEKSCSAMDRSTMNAKSLATMVESIYGSFKEAQATLARKDAEIAALRLCVAEVSDRDNALIALDTARARIAELSEECELKVQNGRTWAELIDQRDTALARIAELERERDEVNAIWESAATLLRGRFDLECMSIQAPGFAAQAYDQLRARITTLEGELAKVREFKTYVHDRLDKAGVPHTVEDQHLNEGCRIGGRLDWLDNFKKRLLWLHDSGGCDAEGYEWGVYRVKWEDGKAVDVQQTLSDLSDLDAARASNPEERG